MNPALRVVTTMPLGELFDASGPVPATRGPSLDGHAVRAVLRAGGARVAVARMGAPLAWLAPGDETFAFWKDEVGPPLWDPSVERVSLDEVPDGRAWSASEWRSADGSVVALFEEHH